MKTDGFTKIDPNKSLLAMALTRHRESSTLDRKIMTTLNQIRIKFTEAQDLSISFKLQKKNSDFVIRIILSAAI